MPAASISDAVSTGNPRECQLFSTARRYSPVPLRPGPMRLRVRGRAKRAATSFTGYRGDAR